MSKCKVNSLSDKRIDSPLDIIIYCRQNSERSIYAIYSVYSIHSIHSIDIAYKLLKILTWPIRIKYQITKVGRPICPVSEEDINAAAIGKRWISIRPPATD